MKRSRSTSSELRAGDAVIWSRPGRFNCHVAVIRLDGESCESLTDRWRPWTTTEALRFAEDLVRQTRGQIWIWEGAGAPQRV